MITRILEANNLKENIALQKQVKITSSLLALEDVDEIPTI